MDRYARLERQGLADDLLSVGPEAPTLCAGWTARDLAAHVVTRDRRGDAAPGIMIQALAGWTEHVRRRYRDGHSYPELVGMVRHEPWWSPMRIPVLDEITNLVEFFVHREDVRRAQPDRQPRPLDRGLARALWQRVPMLARLRLRRLPAEVTVSAPGFGSVRTGAGGPAVEIGGAPGELMLYLFGRPDAAQIDITGPEDLVTELRRHRYTV
jgi:uncharacterized protein (TIGR03085 family)